MSELEETLLEAIEFYKKVSFDYKGTTDGKEAERFKNVLHRIYYRAKKNEKRVDRGGNRLRFGEENDK